MSNTYRTLPQLQSLVYFEAAARHLNFTAAATELGATQPAISQRVRAMEESLGTQLFHRQHRGVRLTAEGLRLYDTVRESLEALKLATLQASGRDEAPVLTIATDFGFAKLWLMPRMHALRRALPELQLRVLTSQDEITHGDVDFTIAFEPVASARGPHTPGIELLLPERVVPVCSPELLPQRRACKQAADLQSLPLLHLHTPEPARWMSWAEWFSAQGVAHEDDSAGVLCFNDYSLVVQAAAAGHGVALGWAPLVDELLDRGDLVIAHDRPLQTERGYVLTRPPAHASRPLNGMQARFRDWLVDACRASTAEPNGMRAWLEGAAARAQGTERIDGLNTAALPWQRSRRPRDTALTAL